MSDGIERHRVQGVVCPVFNAVNQGPTDRFGIAVGQIIGEGGSAVLITIRAEDGTTMVAELTGASIDDFAGKLASACTDRLRLHDDAPRFGEFG